MEDHRFPLLADGSHDDPAFDPSRATAEDHERPGNQEGDGKPATTKARRRYARHERDDQQVPGRRIVSAETIDQQRWQRRWRQSQKAELNFEL